MECVRCRQFVDTDLPHDCPDPIKSIRTICGTCNADSEEHTCQKEVKRLRYIVSNAHILGCACTSWYNDSRCVAMRGNL